VTTNPVAAPTGLVGDAVPTLALEGPHGSHGWMVMWSVEMTKLAAQLKVRIVLAACILGPLLFVIAEAVQSAVPADTLFGQWVHESGFAVSLLILGFCSQWGLPFLMGIVAGDMFAEEDRHGTWSMLLTRSRGRGDVLAGKFLAVTTYSVVVTLLLGLSATLTGALAVGTQPLVGLDGTMLPAGTAWAATAESWVSVLAPALAIMAIAVLVSVLSRNSWVGVVVPLVLVIFLNLVSLLSAIDPVRPFLPTTGFYAWHGLLRASVYTNQLWTSVLVSAAWLAGCLVWAAAAFVRRDVVAS
jgi:ABC-2 type transport system permease protein